MLLEAYLTALTNMLDLMFGWVNLPEFPEWITSSITWFVDTLFDNLGIVGFFIRWETLVSGAVIAGALIYAENAYLLAMWILRKVPALGID